jgi:hypothetical protein
MTDVAANTTDQQLVKKTHPARGVLWGLMMGLGLSIVLVITKVIPLELVTMLIVLVVGTVAGTLWSIFGPAKQPKDVPAAATESTEVDATMPPPTVDVPQQPADTAVDATDDAPPAT